jgi:hypothetical protein
MAGQVFSGWNPIEDPINFYVLAGMVSPGTVVITGMGQPRIITEIRAPGSAGATCIYAGWKPSHFTATHTLVDAVDWRLWDTFKTILKLPTRGQRGQALDFWHPFAELFEPPIRAVIVEEIGQFQTQDNGSETIEVKYAQFTKHRIQYAKPDAAKTEPEDGLNKALREETETTARLTAERDQLTKKEWGLP